MSEANRALALRWFEEVWNQKRKATIDEIGAPDLVGRMEGIDEDMSREDVKVYWEAMVNAIPDFFVTVDGTSVDGPKVIINWHVKGTHLGPGLGIPPSGKPVGFSGLTWFEFEDGRLIRGWDRWNRGEVIASLMQIRIQELNDQFGLTPRQAQVALLLAERYTHKAIAKDLGISPNTARRHCEQVLAKLGISRKEDVASVLGAGEGSPLARHGSDLGVDSTRQANAAPGPRLP